MSQTPGLLVAGVDEASRVLEWAEAEYPDSALFLYFKSRILRLQVHTTHYQFSLLLLLLLPFSCYIDYVFGSTPG